VADKPSEQAVRLIMLVRSCVPNCWVIFMKLPNCYMTFTDLHINILVWHTSYENPISTTAIICSERTNMHSKVRPTSGHTFLTHGALHLSLEVVAHDIVHHITWIFGESVH
jgi:hypothetical protein